MQTNTLRFALSCVLLVPLLTGCLPDLDTQDTRFYVLGSVPPDTKPVAGLRAEPSMVVDLAQLTVPQYLERPQIVVRVESNQLVVSDFDKWGGSLEKNMTRSLATNLSLLLGTPDIHMDATRRSPGGVDARVEVDVLKFERGPDGRAELSAQWRLLGKSRDDPPVVSRISNLASDPIAGGMTGTVAAMTDLLAELSRDIARAVVEHSLR